MSRRWCVTGVVEAPVEAVFAALLAVGPTAGHDPTAKAGPDRVTRYDAPFGGTSYSIAVEVDRDRHSVAVQGHWWYRGVHTVRESPHGSVLEYRVQNIATRARWAVPLMQRALPRQMRRDLAALLRAIGERLDARAYPTGDPP